MGSYNWASQQKEGNMKQMKVLMYAGLIALALIMSACGGKTTSPGDTNATSSNWDQMKWDQGQWK
jgi:hypothetical protein